MACVYGVCAWRVCMSTGSAQLEGAINENIPEEVYGLDCENKGAVPAAVEALKEWTCLKSAPHKVCVCVFVCVCVKSRMMCVCVCVCVREREMECVCVCVAV